MDTDTCEFEIDEYDEGRVCHREPCGETAAWRLWYLRESMTCCEEHKKESLRDFADRLKLSSDHHINRVTLDTLPGHFFRVVEALETALERAISERWWKHRDGSDRPEGLRELCYLAQNLDRPLGNHFDWKRDLESAYEFLETNEKRLETALASATAQMRRKV